MNERMNDIVVVDEMEWARKKVNEVMGDDRPMIVQEKRARDP